MVTVVKMMKAKLLKCRALMFSCFAPVSSIRKLKEKQKHSTGLSDLLLQLYSLYLGLIQQQASLSLTDGFLLQFVVRRMWCTINTSECFI